MTVSELDRNKIKITLSDTEVVYCFGNYERLLAMSDSVKAAIRALLREVINRNSLADGRIAVQVKARKNIGCEITVTHTVKRHRHRLEEHIFEFSSNESLTLAMLFLYGKCIRARHTSSLYKMPDSYRLTVKCRQGLSLYGITEFGREISCTKSSLEFTREYGKALIINNAIEKYGGIFFKEP